MTGVLYYPQPEAIRTPTLRGKGKREGTSNPRIDSDGNCDPKLRKEQTMNSKKYNDTKKVTPRQKAKFIRDAKAAANKLEVFELAKELAKETAKKAKLESSVKDLALALYACGLCVWNMERTQTAEEYVRRYFKWKSTVYTKLNDTGALGDATETGVHLIAMRKRWRTQIRNLHVAAIGTTDVQINGILFEVGHNAKLWNDSTVEDAMAGPFEGVIYGMIDNNEMTMIMELMKTDVVMALTELASLLYVFKDKNEFLEVMQNDLGRSETLKYRDDLDKIVTVYNPSKQKAWIDRMEGAEFPTLLEYMKALGDNDWLK